MIEKDTIRLLRECDSGVKMGISSLDEVMDYISDKTIDINTQNSVEVLYTSNEHLELNLKYNTIDGHLQNEIIMCKLMNI